MLYGPRDEGELEIAKAVVDTAYVAAGGALHDTDGDPLRALQKNMFGAVERADSAES